MSLITCPDCERQISDAAEYCLGCGRPIAKSLTPEDSAPGLDPMLGEELSCDGCGSTQLKKFSLLYETQRTSSSSKTKIAGVGLSPSGAGVGIGGAKTTGTSITELARRVAPPNKEEMIRNDPAGLGAVAGLVAAFLVSYFVYQAAGFLWAAAVFAIVFVVGIVVGVSVSTVDERFRKAYSRWDRQYLCMRCGATKIQSIEAHQAALQRASPDPELDRLIVAGQTIEAVKHVRARAGLGLAEAVEVVERRREQLS